MKKGLYFKYEKPLMFIVTLFMVTWYITLLQGCTPQPKTEKIVCKDGYYLDSKSKECERMRF